uniref:MBD domain-containing protein n=1 Tax=Rhabditophanes sp. KR3021 TaxID=114890 RepID=A0AC35TPG3_9BILA
MSQSRATQINEQHGNCATQASESCETVNLNNGLIMDVYFEIEKPVIESPDAKENQLQQLGKPTDSHKTTGENSVQQRPPTCSTSNQSNITYKYYNNRNLTLKGSSNYMYISASTFFDSYFNLPAQTLKSNGDISNLISFNSSELLDISEYTRRLALFDNIYYDLNFPLADKLGSNQIQKPDESKVINTEAIQSEEKTKLHEKSTKIPYKNLFMSHINVGSFNSAVKSANLLVSNATNDASKTEDSSEDDYNHKLEVPKAGNNCSNIKFTEMLLNKKEVGDNFISNGIKEFVTCEDEDVINLFETEDECSESEYETDYEDDSQCDSDCSDCISCDSEADTTKSNTLPNCGKKEIGEVGWSEDVTQDSDESDYEDTTDSSDQDSEQSEDETDSSDQDFEQSEDEEEADESDKEVALYNKHRGSLKERCATCPNYAYIYSTDEGYTFLTTSRQVKEYLANKESIPTSEYRGNKSKTFSEWIKEDALDVLVKKVTKQLIKNQFCQDNFQVSVDKAIENVEGNYYYEKALQEELIRTYGHEDGTEFKSYLRTSFDKVSTEVSVLHENVLDDILRNANSTHDLMEVSECVVSFREWCNTFTCRFLAKIKRYAVDSTKPNNITAVVAKTESDYYEKYELQKKIKYCFWCLKREFTKKVNAEEEKIKLSPEAKIDESINAVVARYVDWKNEARDETSNEFSESVMESNSEGAAYYEEELKSSIKTFILSIEDEEYFANIDAPLGQKDTLVVSEKEDSDEFEICGQEYVDLEELE